MRYTFFSILLLYVFNAWSLPRGFVYLQQVDPTILQELRYACSHNFVGRPIAGYSKQQCILTLATAEALKRVQVILKTKNLSLKVYDCYRPTQATIDFLYWSQNADSQEMRSEFYPNVNKADFFRLGYVSKKSGHSRGSTVDLTIVPLPTPKQAEFQCGQKLLPCTADYTKRFKDNSVDMGTGYDCLDPKAFFRYHGLTKRVFENRLLLRNLMVQNGFKPYDKEWWHFTLRDEPYPKRYFNFTVK